MVETQATLWSLEALTALSIAVAAASVVVGVVDSILSNRRARESRDRELETRQAQFFMQIQDNFHKPEFFNEFADILTWKWEDYDDFMQKYGPKTNPKAWHSYGSVALFFEGIGVFVYRKLIDVSLVAELMSRHILLFWEKIQPITKEMRRRLDMPLIDLRLEYLYNEIKPVIEKQRVELEAPGPKKDRRVTSRA